jgi:hypothetical protein
MVSTPMMPTMISAGTPYSLSARASVSALSCQKAQARADAHRVDEAAAVHPPVLGRALGRRQHELGHLGQKARLADGLAHPFAVQVAALGQVVGKLHGLGARGVDGAAVRCGAAGGGGSLGFARILVFLGASAYGYCASSY